MKSLLQVAEKMEARVGIEPTHKGFADLSLTTWVPRLRASKVAPDSKKVYRTRQVGLGSKMPSGEGFGKHSWSGRRDLNPRLRPWQGRTLPLSYSRSAGLIINEHFKPGKPTKV